MVFRRKMWRYERNGFRPLKKMILGLNHQGLYAARKVEWEDVVVYYTDKRVPNFFLNPTYNSKEKRFPPIRIYLNNFKEGCWFSRLGSPANPWAYLPTPGQLNRVMSLKQPTRKPGSLGKAVLQEGDCCHQKGAVYKVEKYNRCLLHPNWECVIVRKIT